MDEKKDCDESIDIEESDVYIKQEALEPEIDVNCDESSDPSTTFQATFVGPKQEQRIIDSTIFCGENEIPLRGHWATDGRKPFRKEGRFSSVARVQIKLTQRSENAPEKLY
ncbi:hypothetical protein J6590_066685 [Homalodisca vitripennis]|nr:hypothetical protein J6590_066685 [Homalodisca vitripennis]